MQVGDKPYVIEYNCRMGDPETEIVFPRIKSDLLQHFVALSNGTLANETIDIDKRAAATVIVASGGYPEDYLIEFEDMLSDNAEFQAYWPVKVGDEMPGAAVQLVPEPVAEGAASPPPGEEGEAGTEDAPAEAEETESAE